MQATRCGIARQVRHFARGAIAAFGLAGSLAGAASLSVDAVPSQGVYMVEARSADGVARQGSAVAIDRDTLVTNCHVTRRAANILVARGKQTWRATVRAGNADLDLCVLSAPFAVTQAVRLRDAVSVAVGEPIYAAGYPSGQGLNVRPGTVTALHRHENSNVIQVSAPFEFGASGGGLFDRSGNLVGVLTFKVVGTEGRYFAVPTDWIARVIGESGPGRAGPRFDDAPAFWERSPGALPTFLARLAHVDQGARGAGTSGSLQRVGDR